MFFLYAKVNKNQSGFTILEVLLVIAIVFVLAGFSVPVYRYFQVQNELDVTRDAIVYSLRRAQILSQSVDGDISWGVDVRSGQVTIFKGSSYALRDSDYDEIFQVADNISFSGLGEIVFSKVFGEPNTSGSIVETSVLGDFITIDINSKGMISY